MNFCVLMGNAYRHRMIREMQRKRDEIMNGEMGLVHRFIQFVSSVLNRDMEGVYQKYLPLFEGALDGSEDMDSHTHEQSFMAASSPARRFELGQYPSHVACQYFLPLLSSTVCLLLSISLLSSISPSPPFPSPRVLYEIGS